MLCRIALQTGDLDTVESWYREKAPRNPQQINVMKRYQYLTQAMAELADGRPDAALLTLAPLGTYCQVCRRHIDGIHRNMLCAIALYRQDNKAWQEHLTAALDAAQAFSFIRTISMYGNAALSMSGMPAPRSQRRMIFRRTYTARRSQAPTGTDDRAVRRRSALRP